MDTKAKVLIVIALVFGAGLGAGVSCLAISDHTAQTSPETGISNTMNSGSAGMNHQNTSLLSNKTGDEFDKAFIKEMIVHHEGAIYMAQLALENANHIELKTLSNDIITAQAAEIKQMKDWMAIWYNQ